MAQFSMSWGLHLFQEPLEPEARWNPKIDWGEVVGPVSSERIDRWTSVLERTGKEPGFIGKSLGKSPIEINKIGT